MNRAAFTYRRRSGPFDLDGAAKYLKRSREEILTLLREDYSFPAPRDGKWTAEMLEEWRQHESFRRNPMMVCGKESRHAE